ncbi:anthranilate phosphoribosyltransferase [Cytobacillus oceanisediminis]|jgi:anthranilate phosphoribosyltransferase|uniref:Anthranilate phosphoribosyltransferase n=1 Tax=Cytobacillus oceanisediminis TaxID=665099 RepID=A0A2V2ZC97_9BACI|nr:anthranilate phosphoribosyltransferase [Cytobacillus oceanisediminis]PWW17515.1 anthranilate phosphoribosyltransferase [Cytobacillus oceanisediminis]
MKTILQRLSDRESLTEAEMKEAMDTIFSNDVTDSEIAAFMVSLKTKGETVDEIAGIVRAMRDKSLTFSKNIPNVLDNCGTGGDGSSSFNISSTSAFVIAGAGIPVAKHGNRSVSSKTGSADVLEHLGINLNNKPERTEEILGEIGIAFLFAPHVHPNIKRIMKVRKDLRIPTTFNLIGPLTNPVELENQLLGIYRRDYTMMFAEVLKTLGRKRAVVLNGAGFMDEASLQGENHLAILDNGEVFEKILHPEEVGLPVYSNDAIRGGDSRENAEILLNVLKGEKGAKRDTVLLNAGIGIFTGGKAETIQKGINIARESIDSGAALDKLQQLIKASKSFQKEVI